MKSSYQNSLANPRSEERDKRRALADLTATNTPPANGPTEADVSKGIRTRGYRYLHLLGLAVGGTSFELTLWTKSDAHGYWSKSSELTPETFLTADGARALSPIDVSGVDEVFLQVSSVTGATANVWLSGSTF